MESLSLVRKEWRQARLNLLVVCGLLFVGWVVLVEPWYVEPRPFQDQTLMFQALASLFAGLQLALAQFGSESALKTQELLVFRSSGPDGAFRAKAFVGLLGSTAFACAPLALAFAWFAWTAEEGRFDPGRRGIAFAQVGTLAWAGWGLGAFASQLRRGWGTRIAAAALGGAGSFGLAAIATRGLATAPLWADWLVPLASLAFALALTIGAGRAFAAGVDDERPLEDGPGLALAGAGALALAFPLALAGPGLSGIASRALRDSFATLVEREPGALDVVPAADWSELSHDARPTAVVDPYWMKWGWPEPDPTVEPVVSQDAFALGGRFTTLTETSDPNSHFGEPTSWFEWRDRRVHVAGARGCELLGGPWPRDTLILRGSAGALLVDFEHRELTLARTDADGQVVLEPASLPNGDRLVGVERLVTRAWVEVGYEAPFRYENGLVLRGERGLYQMARGRAAPADSNRVLEPYERAPDDRSVLVSLAREGQRYRTGYARYDGLDPEVEVRDATTGERLFAARLAPGGLGTAAWKALALAASLLHTPLSSLASFANEAPWRAPSRFADPAQLGGRRAWLLALHLVLVVWLAWSVRRETAGWRRSPRLATFWVVVTALLGIPGYLLYRMIEPASAPTAETSGERPLVAHASASPAPR